MMVPFERPHHQRIAQVLYALHGPLLRANNCLFGGGTAIALRHGEYRESVDIDFLVSDIAGYRHLRQLLTGQNGFANILHSAATSPMPIREVRADQYGIRTVLRVADHPIKFEMILEGRIALAAPSATDDVCGIATLTSLDMATSKLLANSDRWGDEGIFNRDVIDLAMMKPPLNVLQQAVTKAQGAYGNAILQDLDKALHKLKTRQGWLDHCMTVLAMNTPKAVVWQRLRALRKCL